MSQARALTGLRIWDGVSDRYLDGADAIRIEGARIAAIGSGRELAAGAEVQRFDGAAALPGLCDAHVHMTLDATKRPPADQLETPRAVAERAMAERALAMLRSGITTARDMGGGAWLELDLRDRIARGEIPGPRLLCAGQPVTSIGGHCHFWGGEASGEQEIRSTVRRQVERGADWIKVMATGGVLTRGTSTGSAQFGVAELTALVDEAGRHGRGVAAHCHGTPGIRNAVAARVQTIEHCSWVGPDGFGSGLDSDVVRAMASHAIWASPTVNAGWRRFFESGERGARFRERMRECYRAMRQAGVRFVASTDAGIPGVEHHRLPEALRTFARYAELTPSEALRTATSHPARALGLADVTGSLRPGLAADLLIVAGDPLSDLAALEAREAVFARGRPIDLA
jgi:imidazolonepropionase-like amidohydrolase